MKKQLKCSKCRARYWKKEALEKHLLKIHPFKEFISYFSLVNMPGQWGQEFTDEKSAKEFKKSPSDYGLMMGILARIWKEFWDIKEEIKRERIIK